MPSEPKKSPRPPAVGLGPMSGRRVLVVEDEEDIARMLAYNLSREGFAVTAVTRAEEGLKIVQELKPDLILLDLMLPGMDGLEFCKRLRYSLLMTEVAVVMLTAKSDESEVVTGLEVGADDYVTKPFSPRVLMARLRAVLRRRERGVPGKTEPERPREVVRAKDLVLHPGRFEASLAGERLELTHTEFLVLHFLAKNPGWVYSRREIVDGVRGERYPVTERAVDVLIVGLRKKLGRWADYIETVRAAGYRFQP